jgi:hypothetical protein
VGSLRVGIDGRAFSSPAAGVRRYVSALVPALGALGAPLDLVVLGGSPADVPGGLEHEPEPRHPPTNLGWTLVGCRSRPGAPAVDLLHAPAYTAPVGHPDSRRGADSRRQLRAPTPSGIRTGATGCGEPSIAPARGRPRGSSPIPVFSASEIHAAYAIPLDRIDVVAAWRGATLRRRGRGVGRAGAVRAARRRPAPRRNLPVVLDAVIALRRRGGGDRRTDAGAGRRRSRLVCQLQAAAAAAGATEALACSAS